MTKKTYKLKITIPLPYRLNILDFPEMDYSELNIENPKYLDSKLKIGFKDDINYKTKLIIEIISENEFTDDRINRFPIMESRKIVNILVRSYQSITGEYTNAGLISPIGTAYLQLNSEIEVNCQNARDRYPYPSFSTCPISSENQSKIIEIVTGKRAYSSEIVNLTQAKELLERGYYTLSYLQFVRSVEESITKYIILKMRANNCSPSEIDVYKTLSLGQKLKNFPMGDPRKLDTHFGSNPNWRSIWDNLWNMKLKRDLLMHYSTEATRLEALQVRSWVIDFRKIL